MTEKDIEIQKLRRELKAYKDTKIPPSDLADYKALCESYVKAGLDAKFIQVCIDATQSGVTIADIQELIKRKADIEIHRGGNDGCRRSY